MSDYLIDLQTAIEAMSCISDSICEAEAVDALCELPTVDAVPVRHGKWTVTSAYITCSECGESFPLISQNYCPNCGARMEKA